MRPPEKLGRKKQTVNLVECWFLSREECDPFQDSAHRNMAKQRFIGMVEDSNRRRVRMRQAWPARGGERDQV